MSRCKARDKDLGRRCVLIDGHKRPDHDFAEEEHVVTKEESSQASPVVETESVRRAVLQALNALSEAVHAMNPLRDDLAVMATNQGIMVFYDKSKGFPALPCITASTRDR